MSDFNIAFYSREYWEDYYKENGFSGTLDWYFELQGINLKNFNLDNLDRNSEIMIVGVGCSSLIDHLASEKFQYITLVDFSRRLIDYLKGKFEPHCDEWDCKNII
jgi:hypothetical protein